MDIYSAGLPVEVEPPGFLQDLLTTKNPSAVFGKSEEQVKFLRTQVKGLKIEAHFTPRRINGQVTEMDWSRVVCVTLGAPQDGFDAGNKFARVERLGQVIVCTKLKAENLVDVFIASVPIAPSSTRAARPPPEAPFAQRLSGRAEGPRRCWRRQRRANVCTFRGALLPAPTR